MLIKFRSTLLYFITLVIFSQCQSLASFDMRNCPINRVVYLNAWSGDIFEVHEFGYSYSYRCDDGATWSEIETKECSARYGIQVLAGTLFTREDATGIAMTIMHESMIGNAPCCGSYSEKQSVDQVKLELPELKWSK